MNGSIFAACVEVEDVDSVFSFPISCFPAALCLLLRKHKSNTAMRAITATPPTTPPTIGPILVFLLCDEVLEPVEVDVVTGEDVDEDLSEVRSF